MYLNYTQASDVVIIQSDFKYITKPTISEVNKELVKPNIVKIRYTEHSKEFMILNLKITFDQTVHRNYRDQKD